MTKVSLVETAMWTNLDTDLLERLPKKPMNGIASHAPTWTSVAAKLNDFRKEYSEDGWDGQGATAIPSELVDSACRLASKLESRDVEIGRAHV